MRLYIDLSCFNRPFDNQSQERIRRETQAVNADLEEKTRQIGRQGIPALDAAHLASAEAGGAEIMLTCDDVILRRVQRLGLALRF
jgi:predicted nucleic acid-binding protein